MAGSPGAGTFGLVESPPSQHYHGHPVTVRLANSGTVPLRIHAETLVLKSGCAQQVAEGMTVRPARFTLQPHQGVTVTITVPQVRGDYGALFVAASDGHSAVVQKAIGEQVYQGAGVTSCIRHVHSRAVAHHGGGLPVGLIAGGAVLAVVLVLGFVLARTVRRRRVPPDVKSVADKYMF